MDIKTNADLAAAVIETIKESGVKKIWIAEKLGTSRQNLDKMLKKQAFTLDDANSILDLLHKKVNVKIEEK